MEEIRHFERKAHVKPKWIERVPILNHECLLLVRIENCIRELNAFQFCTHIDDEHKCVKREYSGQHC